MQGILVTKGIRTPIHMSDIRFPFVQEDPEVQPITIPSQITFKGTMDVEWNEGAFEKLQTIIEETEEKDLFEAIESVEIQETTVETKEAYQPRPSKKNGKR